MGAPQPRVDPQREPQWRYLVRIAVLLGLAAAGVLFLSIGVRTVNTLRRLEVVEAERDLWQRPQDVLRSMELRPGQTALDVGCGAGYFALKLSALVGDQGRVTAVDVRPLSLAFLRLRAALAGRHNLVVIHGDATDAPLPSDLDAVLIANTFHELREPGPLLAHLRRALRRGGRLVVIDPGRTAASDRRERHLVASEAVHQLEAAGFAVVSREDRFLADPDGDAWWLLVARRP